MPVQQDGHPREPDAEHGGGLAVEFIESRPPKPCSMQSKGPPRAPAQTRRKWGRGLSLRVLPPIGFPSKDFGRRKT